ncbi:MAG: hypothetical protein JRH11_00430 [Deltaproteobacteria bacterium]|nr:hypothetical protein [Deltaproteobacteria bacterium]
MNTHARELNERGYSVFEDLVGPAEVQSLKETIEGDVAELAPLRLSVSLNVELSGGAVITAAGLALTRLFDARPALLERVLPARLVDAMRAFLGEAAVLEVAGAVVNDASRPFFPWHTHIDGIDEGERVQAGEWPEPPEAQRVFTVLYLQDLDEETGPLYVLPRRSADPTPPPHPMLDRTWPGMVELRPRAGTLVALDQCLWHAAASLTRPGLRTFVGCYFAALDAPRHPWANPGLTSAPLPGGR